MTPPPRRVINKFLNSPGEARGGQGQRQGHVRGAREGALRVADRVERFGSRATVSFESLHIRIPLKFCQNSAKLSQVSEMLNI